MPPISGSLLLIIGGTSGIGFAVAQQALSEGSRVIVASSKPEKGEIGGEICDLRASDLEAHLKGIMTRVKDARGGEDLDHAIITAADFSGTKKLSDITPETVIDATQLRLIGPVMVAKFASRFLKKIYTSSLTLTAGGVILRPFPGWPLASAFAGGLEGLTLRLALDMAPIRVNIIHPGATMTELWGSGRVEHAEQMAKTALLGRVGIPEEVAETYIYAMKNGNLIGSALHSNGGAHLK